MTQAFCPIGERSLYEPPRATISDQRGASWLRRTLPLVLSHKAMFFTAVIGAFAGLVVQVQIPTVIGHAIDNAIVAQTSPLAGYVFLLFILGAARWILNLTSRTLLLKTAYRIEFDLRNIVYEHLTHLSFSFFDRVQSGELMARSNSDVRAVQMYLATAPVILAQCAVAVVVIIEMLLINPVLAVVATITMPFIGVLGIKVRQRLFPVSWLVQAGSQRHPPPQRGRQVPRRQRLHGSHRRLLCANP